VACFEPGQKVLINEVVPIACVVLAAGGSKRFEKGHKLLAPFQGKPLILHLVHKLDRMAVGERILVLGCQGKAIQELVQSEVQSCWRFVQNPEWQEGGLSGSLKLGVQGLVEASVRGAAIFLADKPEVRVSTLNKLFHGFLEQPRSPLQPFFQGVPGHPVCFPESWFMKLKGLRGDMGAGALLREHEKDIRHFETSDHGVIKDCDRLGDF